MQKVFSLIALLLLCSAARAGIVELVNEDKRQMQADFRQGATHMPVVLILHGFLQTREFSTVRNLAESLHDAGFTTLTPTLTLGIQKRRQSLPCEAIHTHSLTSDTAEITQWVEWLHQKTGRPVTLVGHSSGAITLLNYLESHGADRIQQIMLISLAPFIDQDDPVKTSLRARAESDLEKGLDRLSNYSLSYCRIYRTTASAYLSYSQWDRQQLSDLVVRYSAITDVILGTEDKRINPQWLELLRSKKVRIHFVEGANHFYDRTHEFELADAIEDVLLR